MVRSKGMILFSLALIASIILAGCSPSATPQPVVQTVIVTQMVEGTPVQVVVTPTPGAETTQEAPSGEFLPADGLVACQPLPELPQASQGGFVLTSYPKEAPSQNPIAAQQQAAKAVNEAFYGKLTPVLQEGGKIYRVGVFEDVTSLNYFQANGPDNTVWNSYMLPSRLAMYAISDVYFSVVPVLAAVATPDPLQQEGDFWVTTIPMREDVSWSDGQPLTARDVAFSANVAVKFGLFAGNWSQYYDSNFLDHIEAVDDYTVKYYYHTKPGMARHEWGVLQGPVLAEHFWAPLVDQAAVAIDALPEGTTDDERVAAQTTATEALFNLPVDGEPTAGAFVLSKREPGAFIDQSAQQDFFLSGMTIKNWANGAYEDSQGVKVGTPEGDPSLTYEVGPYVDGVVYTIYGSQDAAILALKNGEVDFVLNSLGLQRGLAAQIENDPNLKVLENPVNGFRYLSFNNRRRPMNDCAFRQAVAVLIDKEFVANTILQGAAIPYYTFVAPGNTPWYSDDVTKLGLGLTREQRMNYAIQILEQGGFTWEGGNKPTWDAEGEAVVAGGRLIMPDGQPVPNLNLWAPSAGYDPLRSTFAIWIETWLKEMGIPVTAQLAGFNVLIPKIFTEQDFDMYILGYSLSIFPSHLRDFFSEEQAASGGNNAGGYINPDFEELSQGILTCSTYEECRQVSDEIQRFLSIETPMVALFDTGIIEAYRTASVEYPYEAQLSGLQYTHQFTGGPGLQAVVKVK